MVTEWLQKNAWSLAIGAITLISTFTIYGYRLDSIEKQTELNRADIISIQQTNNQNAVALAQIQKDIEFIKFQLSKLVP